MPSTNIGVVFICCVQYEYTNELGTNEQMKSILHSTHLYTLFVVRQEKNLTYVKADVTIIHRSLLCGFGPIWSSYPNQSNPENCRLNKSRVCIYVSEKMCVYTEAPISLSVRKQPPSSRTNPFLLPRPISLAFL